MMHWLLLPQPGLFFLMLPVGYIFHSLYAPLMNICFRLWLTLDLRYEHICHLSSKFSPVLFYPYLESRVGTMQFTYAMKDFIPRVTNKSRCTLCITTYNLKTSRMICSKMVLLL